MQGIPYQGNINVEYLRQETANSVQHKSSITQPHEEVTGERKYPRRTRHNAQGSLTTPKPVSSILP